MRYRYWHSCLICAYELISICDMSVVFVGHICWYVCVYSMENKSCTWVVFFFVLFDFLTGMSNNVGSMSRLHYWATWPQKKNMLHLIFIIFNKGMQWCQWQCCWHQVMWMLVPMMSPDQKSDIALHFIFFDLRNKIVPLTTLITSCDANTGSSGVSDQKVM